MRTSAGVFSLLLVLSVFGQATSPDAFLDRGTSAYRQGDFPSAAIDLQAAVQAYMSSENMRRYVNTGKFENLDKLEQALVYLALAQSKLGREGEARDTILRLISAERIEPTYARLPIADASEFESLVSSLVPASGLTPNTQLATATPPATEEPAPLPTVVATATDVNDPQAPLPTVVAGTTDQNEAQAPLPAVTAAADQPERRFVTMRTVAEERAERERIVAELVAIERAKIEQQAAARIAEEKQAAERAAAERISAAEQRISTVEANAQQRIAAADAEARQKAATAEAEAAQKAAAAAAEAQQKAAAAEAEAQQRIAAAQREAEQRIAALRNESQERLTVAEADAAARIAAAKKEADERIAAAQSAAKREAEARIIAEREAAERAAAAQIAEATANARRSFLTSLRQAEAMANKGDLAGANEIYVRVANSENAPREVIAEAAVGLYRTGAFRNSVAAFKRLGMFAKGEEDLRYYNAVALFETGSYQEAKKELACALPFIQVTEDVTRYRTKIEQTASQQARR